jgi:hypothetical protein
MRWPLVLVVLVAACGQKGQLPENQASATEKLAEANVAGNVAGVSVEAANGTSPEAGKLPPANAALRFVGKWARTQAECSTKPWLFSAKSVSAARGPNCSFYKVTPMPGGYDVAATCPAKEPVHTDLIKLRFAESAGAMLIESNAIPPTGLVYCGK